MSDPAIDFLMELRKLVDGFADRRETITVEPIFVLALSSSLKGVEARFRSALASTESWRDQSAHLSATIAKLRERIYELEATASMARSAPLHAAPNVIDMRNVFGRETGVTA